MREHVVRRGGELVNMHRSYSFKKSFLGVEHVYCRKEASLFLRKMENYLLLLHWLSLECVNTACRAKDIALGIF